MKPTILFMFAMASSTLGFAEPLLSPREQEDQAALHAIRAHERILVDQWNGKKPEELKFKSYDPKLDLQKDIDGEGVKSEVAKIRDQGFQLFQKDTSNLTEAQKSAHDSQLNALDSIDRMEMMVEIASQSNISIREQLAKEIVDTRELIKTLQTEKLANEIKEANALLGKINQDTPATPIEQLKAEAKKEKESIEPAPGSVDEILALQKRALNKAENLARDIDLSYAHRNLPVSVLETVKMTPPAVLAPPAGPLLIEPVAPVIR